MCDCVCVFITSKACSQHHRVSCGKCGKRKGKEERKTNENQSNLSSIKIVQFQGGGQVNKSLSVLTIWHHKFVIGCEFGYSYGVPRLQLQMRKSRTKFDLIDDPERKNVIKLNSLTINKIQNSLPLVALSLADSTGIRLLLPLPLSIQFIEQSSLGHGLSTVNSPVALHSMQIVGKFALVQDGHFRVIGQGNDHLVFAERVLRVTSVPSQVILIHIQNPQHGQVVVVLHVLPDVNLVLVVIPDHITISQPMNSSSG